MTIRENIKNKIIEAMKEKDKIRILVLKGVSAAFINELITKKKRPDEEFSDELAISVIQKEAKKRKDSIRQFRDGGREDLVEREEVELKILEEFLPEMMSMEEIEKIAKAKKEELGISDKTKMGVLIGTIMKDLKGKADGSSVKEIVEKLF